MIGVQVWNILLPDKKRILRAIRVSESGIEYILYKKEIWLVERYGATQYKLSDKAIIS